MWLMLGAAAALAAWTATLAARAVRGAGPSGFLLFGAILLIGWAQANRAVRIDARADVLARRFAQASLCRVEGRVCEPPSIRGDSMRVALAETTVASAPIGAARFPLKVLVALIPDERHPGKPDPPPQGARIAAWGRLEAPARGAFPGDLDEAALQHGRGVGARLVVKSAGDIELIAPARGAVAAALNFFARLRARAIANIRAPLSTEEAAIAVGFLFGDTSGLAPEARRDYQRTALAHVLSVSGLHTGLVLAMILAAARLALLPPRRAAAVGIVGVAFYCALAGFDPPVVRSAMMGSFVLFAWAIGRTSSTLAALAAAAFVSLLLDPRNFTRIDWQLSYLCAASIALLADPIFEIVPERETPVEELPAWRLALSRVLRGWVWRPLSAVIAVQIGLLPLQLAIFRQFSIVGIPAQAIMLPQATLILFGAVALALLGWLPPVAAVLGPAVGEFTGFFQWQVAALSAVPRAAVAVPPMPWWWLAAYAGFMAAGPHLLRGRARDFAADRPQRIHALWRVLALFVAVAWTPILAAPPRGLMELNVADVGQGDGMVLRLPNGKIGVIDGGRRWGRAEPPIARYCRSLGARRLDFVVATHADSDHIGGLVWLAENFEIGVFIRSPDVSDSGTFADLEAALKRRRVKVHIARAGERIAGLGDVEAHVISPAPGLDNNNASLTILLQDGDIRVLLTGDIQAEAERSILERGLACDIDVLKVAHHGSAGSSTPAFLDAVRPEIALISAGRGNAYGHPAPSALARLAERGATIARTDELGSLRLTTDGKRTKLERWGGE